MDEKIAEPTATPAPDAAPAVTAAPATPEVEIAVITKPCLWMLVNHIEYAIGKGVFAPLATEEQFEVLKNVLVAKQSLGGWKPQEQRR